MPPRTRRTSSNHPAASATEPPSKPAPALVPVVEIPLPSRSRQQQELQEQARIASDSAAMSVGKKPAPAPATGSSSSSSSSSKRTTVSPGSSGNVTPEKQQKRSNNAFAPGTTPVKFYEEEMRKMNMQSKVQASRQQPRATAQPRSQGFSLKALAVQLVVAYALIAYFFICPNDPSRAPAVCQSYTQLQQYRNQALSYATPYTKPYTDALKSNAEAYYGPYVRASAPYYARAHGALAPQASKIRKIYERQVKPRMMDAFTHSHKTVTPHFNRLSKQYDQLVTPHVNRYSGLAEELYDLNVRPHIDEVSASLDRLAGPQYRRASSQLRSFANMAYPAVEHHAKHTLYPFASQTYTTSSYVYNDHIHPRVLVLWQYVKAFLNGHFAPALRRFNSKYISPQLSKIQDKAWANRAKQVAVETVREMDQDLGKDDLQDEIADLLRDIKASAHASSTVSEGTFFAEPTAIDTQEKDDIIAQKLAAEEEKRKATAEKRAALTSLHDMYETEIAKLGETELKLLAERLASLRQTAQRDIPVRFDLAMKNFKEDCDKWIGRLEKYYEKSTRDERTPVDEKIADGVLIARKAASKLADQADELEDEIDGYGRTHNVRELTSVEKAFKTIASFVGKAQEELGMGYTWLDDVTPNDWTRYHTLAAMEGSWHHQFAGLKNGSVAHPSLKSGLSIDPVLQTLKRELDSISADAEARLETVQKAGEAKIQGSFPGVRQAVAQGTDKVAEVFEQVTHLVKGTTPTPTDISGTVSSVYSEASVSAESAYSVVADSAEDAYSVASSSATSAYSVVSDSAESVLSDISAAVFPTDVAKALDDARSSLSSGLSVASESLLSLARQQPSATGASASASSLLAQATSYLVEVQDSAESMYHSYASVASSNAYVLAGRQPTPTDLQGTASSAYSVASESAASAADKMASEISYAANNAQQLLAQIAGDAYAALPSVTLPSTDDIPALSDVTSTLSSQLHEATRSAASAAGLSVSPEGVAEHVSSLYNDASSLAASAVDEASSQLHTASRTLASAVGVKPTPESVGEYVESVASEASAAVSQATEAVRQHVEL